LLISDKLNYKWVMNVLAVVTFVKKMVWIKMKFWTIINLLKKILTLDNNNLPHNKKLKIKKIMKKYNQKEKK